MELKITENKEEPLLSRKKITSEVNFKGAIPSRKDLKSKIASSVNAKESLVVVRNIYTNFGAKKADITAYVYNDEKDMESIEVKTKEKKKKEQKAEAKTEVTKEVKQEKTKEASKQEKVGKSEEVKEKKTEETKETKKEKPKEVKE